MKIAYHMKAIKLYPAILDKHFSRLISSGLYDVVEGYCGSYLTSQTQKSEKQACSHRDLAGRQVYIAGTLASTTHYERFTVLGIMA